jgi:methylenetetrahydrofolate dehydrogenase (NADP+)/methenyltetrahydrofolate cyclohydrolase
MEIAARYSSTMHPVLSEARVLNGVSIASEIKAEVAEQVAAARSDGYTPGLAVVLVGENPASQIYVRSKIKTCAELGIRSEMHTPPATITTEELLALVRTLNERDDVDGILIQLPLPAQVNTDLLLEAVDPRKDVDGFHPINAGRLLSGVPIEAVLAPCTPAGILEVLRRSEIPIGGARAVVLGRSNIVGKPVAAMLINASATVTVCHSRTRDLPSITREADILVAAIGRAGFVTPEMVRPGSTIIDVGINRLTSEAEFERFFPPEHPEYASRRESFAKRGSTVIGDVDPAAFSLAGAYTPVPGGVGALTIAMLMSNTVKAARLRRSRAGRRG